MGGYLATVIGVALCVGLLEELLPASGESRTYIRLLTALCILAVMVAPLGNLLRELPEFFAALSVDEQEAEKEKYDEILEGTVKEAVRERLCDAICDELIERFSVERENITVGISFSEDEGVVPERVIITLGGKDIIKDPYEIEDYFEKLLRCECLVLSR